MLVINDPKFFLRAEIIREKGTNRSAFFRGEVAKYSWVDIGSSFLPSDITAAVLFAQLEKLKLIQRKRVRIWNMYYKGLQPLAESGHFELPFIPSYATNNAHLFYIVCHSQRGRQALVDFLKKEGISAIFHYLPLHRSSYYRKKHAGGNLPNCDFYSRCLLRLPLYCNLRLDQVEYIIQKIIQFFCATASKEPPATLGSTQSK